MNILVTMEDSSKRKVYFPEKAIEQLGELGNVRLNDKEEPYTQEELAKEIRDVDVCITHWDSPVFTEDVLKNAGRLVLIAHAAGSVADLVTDSVYSRNIRVCSANDIMAKYVAEGVLTYFLASLRMVTLHNNDMKIYKAWNRRIVESRSLYGEKIGLIGLGTVGMYLLDLLEPFDVKIRLYDPYLRKEVLAKHPEVKLCTLDEALKWGNIISVHASLTEETYRMINCDKLKLIKDNAVFVNTARSGIVEGKSLVDELKSGRISAVLDVFDNEPLEEDSPLRYMDNVILMPHMAGSPAREAMTFAIIEEVERYIKGIPLLHEILYGKFKLMTKEKYLKSNH